MKIDRIYKVTGKGIVISATLDEEEIENIDKLIGTNIKYPAHHNTSKKEWIDTKEYKIKSIEATRLLISSLPLSKDVGFIVEELKTPNFEDGFYHTNKDRIIQLKNNRLYSHGEYGSTISTFDKRGDYPGDTSYIDYKNIREKIIDKESIKLLKKCF